MNDLIYYLVYIYVDKAVTEDFVLSCIFSGEVDYFSHPSLIEAQGYNFRRKSMFFWKYIVNVILCIGGLLKSFQLFISKCLFLLADLIPRYCLISPKMVVLSISNSTNKFICCIFLLCKSARALRDPRTFCKPVIH